MICQPVRLVQRCGQPKRACVRRKALTSTYSEFLDKVDAGHITDVKIIAGSPDVQFLQNDGAYGAAKVALSDSFISELRNHAVNISIAEKSGSYTDFVVGNVFPLVLGFALLSMLARRASGPAGGLPMFGNSNYDLDVSKNIETRFTDVAGIDNELAEIKEIVDFLKTPEKFTDAGAVVPRGCLLDGPPGTGKTLLAKAVAGEAGVSFISCSASQFIELFVGLGASRIRGLFATARKNAPCIIFIDELDAIAKQRGGAITAGGGNDEREQTLNQLLTEMDGFADNNGIVLLGATNRSDVIDPAILRPGRFDRKVTVGLPNTAGRLEILKVHSKNKLLDTSVNLQSLASLTTGFSGAELQNVMNEAAIYAARDGRKPLTQVDIESAYEKVSIGLPKQLNYSAETKELVAYHEAGHALLGALNNMDIGKVTILPRGGAGGFTQFVPSGDVIDSGMVSKKYLISQLKVALGGRAAEQVLYGVDNVTTGAVGDLARVTEIAYQMIGSYGFSEMGLMQVGEQNSEDTKAYADHSARELVAELYEDVLATVSKYRDPLDKIASALVRKDTLDGADVAAIVAVHEFSKTV